MAPNNSSQAREAALRRLVLARRWIVAGSVTLAGVLAAVAANAFPGKTVKSTAVNATSEGTSGEISTNTESQSGESSEGSSGSVTPPEQAPQSTEGKASEESGQVSEEAPVVSGGS